MYYILPSQITIYVYYCLSLIPYHPHFHFFKQPPRVGLRPTRGHGWPSASHDHGWLGKYLIRSNCQIQLLQMKDLLIRTKASLQTYKSYNDDFYYWKECYNHWRQSALKSAGALQDGDGEFRGIFTPFYTINFGDGIKVVVHVLQWHQLVWRH